MSSGPAVTGASGRGRAPDPAPARRAARRPGPRAPLSRLAAFGVVAGLSILGPVIESSLGEGRGWMIGFVLMALAPSLLRAGGPRLHPFDPETFVPVMYFLSAGYAPLVHLLSSRYLSLNTAEANAVQVGYLGAVGCALLCAGFSRAPEQAPPGADAPPERVLPRDHAVIITGMLGAGLVVAWIVTTGISTLLAASYADTYLHEEGKGVLVSGWYFMQLAIAYCVARAADFRRRGVRVPRIFTVASAVMLALFLVNTLLGRRGQLVWTGVAAALCLHVSGVRIRRLSIGAALALVMVYGFALEGYRTELGQGAEERLDAARAGLERVDNPFVIPELEGVFANLAILVAERPPLIRYPGESWVNAFLIMIPKPLYADRPTALSQRYVMWASPSFAREGGGYAFNTTGEGFVNLGHPGAVLQVFVFTAAFFFLPLVACVARHRGALSRAFAACLSSFAYNQYRGELASMLKIAVMFALAAFLALLLTEVVALVLERFAGRDPARGLGPRGRAPFRV